MTASISMSCGDIIYSFPTLRKVAEKAGPIDLLICNTHSQYAKRQTVDTYQAVRELALAQPYINTVSAINEGALGNADLVLDKVRKHPRFRTQHIAISHLEAQGEKATPADLSPWLHVKPVYIGTLVNITGKYKEHGIDWKRFFEERTDIAKPIAFVGLVSEIPAWWENVSLLCQDLMRVAQLIAGCELLICEQSAPLTIAQGLGKPHWLAKDRRFNNCSLPNTIHL